MIPDDVPNSPDRSPRLQQRREDRPVLHVPDAPVAWHGDRLAPGRGRAAFAHRVAQGRGRLRVPRHAHVPRHRQRTLGGEKPQLLQGRGESLLDQLPPHEVAVAPGRSAPASPAARRPAPGSGRRPAATARPQPASASPPPCASRPARPPRSSGRPRRPGRVWPSRPPWRRASRGPPAPRLAASRRSAPPSPC